MAPQAPASIAANSAPLGVPSPAKATRSAIAHTPHFQQVFGAPQGNTSQVQRSAAHSSATPEIPLPPPINNSAPNAVFGASADTARKSNRVPPSRNSQTPDQVNKPQPAAQVKSGPQESRNASNAPARSSVDPGAVGAKIAPNSSPAPTNTPKAIAAGKFQAAAAQLDQASATLRTNVNAVAQVQTHALVNQSQPLHGAAPMQGQGKTPPADKPSLSPRKRKRPVPTERDDGADTPGPVGKPKQSYEEQEVKPAKKPTVTKPEDVVEGMQQVWKTMKEQKEKELEEERQREQAEQNKQFQLTQEKKQLEAELQSIISGKPLPPPPKVRPAPSGMVGAITRCRCCGLRADFLTFTAETARSAKSVRNGVPSAIVLRGWKMGCAFWHDSIF